MKKSPTPEQITAALGDADAAVMHAQTTRANLGRRRTPTRTKRLETARARCAEAAEPLRSFIGMVAWHNLPIEQELAMKDAVQRLRYERRQIDKMTR